MLMKKIAPCVQWHIGIIYTGLGLVVVCVVVVFVCFMIRSERFLQIFAVHHIVSITTLLVMWLIRLRVLKICRQAMSKNGSMCAYCRFDLSGLGKTGFCPECGNQYNIEQLRAVWASTEARLLKNKTAR